MSFEPQDDTPRLGARGLHWFRRCLASRLQLPNANSHGLRPPVPAQTLPPLLDWYTDRWQRYVHWEDVIEYRGPRFPVGAWHIDWELVESDLTRALWAVQHAGTEPAEDVVAALLASLDRSGHDPDVQEPRTLDLLSRGQRARYDAARRRLRARWPRTCESCRCEFRGPRADSRQCRRCRGRVDSGRSKRSHGS